MSDPVNAPLPPATARELFWSKVDGKFLIVTVVGLAGLFGPVSSFLSSQAQERADSAAAAHKQRLDFLAGLVKAQELEDESQRVLARLDVLELLNGTLDADDRLNEFVKRELTKTRTQYEALLELQVARNEVSTSEPSGTAAPPSSAVPSATGSGTPPKPQPSAGPPAPPSEAVKVLKAAQRHVAERVLMTTPSPVQQAIAQRAPCTRFAAHAPGSAAPQSELEQACRSADNGSDSWMTRAGTSTVTCSCAAH